MKDSKIEWTSHTFNPWRGCTKVSPGCANCYAETLSHRNPLTLGVWGPKGTRVVASEAMWREPLKWDREAKKAFDFWACGGGKDKPPYERPRVFCASLADVFEDWKGPMSFPDGAHVRKTFDGSGRRGGIARDDFPVTMNDVRARLFRLIDATPNLDWLVLTKRPDNIRKMWPRCEECGYSLEDAGLHMDHHLCIGKTLRPQNVWFGTSVEDRTCLERIEFIRGLPGVHFLSVEPLLEDLGTLDLTGIHWVIVGGESGSGARPCRVEWIRDIVRQCKAASVPVFVKQLGSNIEAYSAIDPLDQFPNGTDFGQATGDGARIKLRDRKGGDISEWPDDLRVREFPEPA